MQVWVRDGGVQRGSNVIWLPQEGHLALSLTTVVVNIIITILVIAIIIVISIIIVNIIITILVIIIRNRSLNCD